MSDDLQIHLSSHDPALLDRALGTLVKTVRESGATLSGPIPLPVERAGDAVKHRRRLTLLSVGSDTLAQLHATFVPTAIDIEITT